MGSRIGITVHLLLWPTGQAVIWPERLLGNPERRMILQDTIVGVGRSHGDEITVRNVQEGFDVRSFSSDFTQVGCPSKSHIVIT